VIDTETPRSFVNHYSFITITITIKQDSSTRASVRAGAAFQLELHSTQRNQNYRG